MDVTRPESVEAWVGEAAEAFGGVDIVLTNAGSVRFGPLVEQSYDDYASTVRSELDSAWLTTRAAWPHLTRSRGCIITIGSTAGISGSLTNHRTAHCAAKGGVIALTRQLAAEGAAHGIRANRVSPGLVDTEGSRGDLLADTHPMRDAARDIPLGRLGTPQDIAKAAVFLASEDASYVSGAHLVVEGGWSAVLPGPLS